MRAPAFATALLFTTLASSGAGLAQSPTVQRPTAPSGPVDSADQVIGLFSATCLNFAGDVAAMRSFLTEQHAPQMPQAARDAFLAGRQGQVFDVSFQTAKLALVSLDDGGCEAVAEHADPGKVVSVLNQAAQENHVTLAPLGAPADAKARPGVQQTAFGLTLAGHPMHILVSTEAPAPQAVLTLIPK